MVSASASGILLLSEMVCTSETVGYDVSCSIPSQRASFGESVRTFALERDGPDLDDAVRAARQDEVLLVAVAVQ